MKLRCVLTSFNRIIGDLGFSSRNASGLRPKVHSCDNTRVLHREVPTIKRVATQFFRATSTLPKKATRFTVLRSPHIDKKSREQFEFVQHRSTITLTYSSATHFFVWLQLQQNPGFQCKVVVTYTTRLLKNKTS